MASWLGRWVAFGVIAGCGPVVPVDSEESESGENESSTSGPSSTSSADTSVGPSSTAGPLTTAPPVTTIEPDPTLTTGGTTWDTDDGLPNGSQCMSHQECASGMCFLSGILGGICGDCLGDFDCSWGCTGPNPVSDPPMGSFCNEGLYGDGCESSNACMGGLLCATVLDVPGVFTRATCGQCISDADCPFGTLCSPDLDIANLGGTWYCIEPGSKPLGGFCNLLRSGDDQCGSGICGVADIMGLLQFGVCSECRLQEDCDPGEMCNPPLVDLDGSVIAGYCE